MEKEEIKKSIKNIKGETIRDIFKDLFTGFKRPFENVQIEVSSRCQGLCSYCPRTVFKREWIDRDMDWQTFLNIWPVLKKSNRVHLQGWGEPFINPHFFEMVELARKAGAQVSTTTNGFLINEDIAEKVVNSGIDIIAFSIAGTDEKSNSSRKNISFGKVCESISLLQRIRKKMGGVHLEIHFAYLLLLSEMESVLKLPELMHELGVHGAVISTLDYIPSKELEAESIRINGNHNIKKALALLEEVSERINNYGLDLYYSLGKKRDEKDGCGENIKNSVVVSSDGDVSPCVLLNVPTDKKIGRRHFGNVNNDDVFSIINKKEYADFRKRNCSDNPEKVCSECLKR